jgi:hypothetical protein
MDGESELDFLWQIRSEYRLLLSKQIKSDSGQMRKSTKQHFPIGQVIHCSVATPHCDSVLQSQ